MVGNIKHEEIKRGLENGVIRIVSAVDDDPMVEIGEYSFYAFGSEYIGRDASEMVDDIGLDGIADMICSVINSYPIVGEDEEDSPEYMYYKAILAEAGCLH